MTRAYLIGVTLGAGFLLLSNSALATTAKVNCRGRVVEPASKLYQEPGQPVRGFGANSPCARPPVAAALPRELPAPAQPKPVPRRGFFGLPLLGLLGGLGAAGLAASAGGSDAVSP